jgi:hypothetical protein
MAMNDNSEIPFEFPNVASGQVPLCDSAVSDD